MSETVVVSEEEMNSCPECGTFLSHDGVEFLGEGLMIVGVECQDCDWYGTEEWVHDQTTTEVEEVED